MKQTERSMEQISAPFPIQKVGVGAKWRVSHVLQEGGMKLRQVTHYELVSFDGRRGKLLIVLKQTGKPQSFTNQGVKARLVRYQATGKGVLAFDLHKLTPKATVAMQADYQVEVSPAGTPMSVTTQMTMEMRVSPKR